MLTLFFSAALMFSLQPMIGKLLLPIVGGAPSGWIVAMAFFQVMLLAGYFLAHTLARFSARWHGILYLLCLAVGYLFLPVTLNRPVTPDTATPIAVDIFRLLTIGVAAPFVAISATASTLQRLFTSTDHVSARDPYFLYAASNLGSFAGLLLYPFLIEPHTALTAQTKGWQLGYLLLMAAAALCLLQAGKDEPTPQQQAQDFQHPSWSRRLQWVALSFIPSALLLAVTAHITTDIFSAPLLWVVPLSIYLLTFVLAFSRRRLAGESWICLTQPPVVLAAIMLMPLAPFSSPVMSWTALGVNLVAFCLTALMCHLRLAQSRPTEDEPRHLTEFYLMLAIGGALGGTLVAFVAPLIFDRLAEYPLLMISSILLNQNLRTRFSSGHMRAFIAALALLCIMSLLFMLHKPTDPLPVTVLIIPLALAMLHPRLAFASGLLIIGIITALTWVHPPLLSERNFYGVIKVFDSYMGANGRNVKPVTGRAMQHGTTLHGFQALDQGLETTPTLYYTREGPLGDVMLLYQPKNVAAIGLGTGTINCYATPKRKITFFEIDSAVVRMAREQFTYLSRCSTKEPRIIVGDARLEMQRLKKGEKFDLIVLDAFSSDSIPTHLLTTEAIQVYLQHLAPKGIMLFHISNRFFDLNGPVAAASRTLKLRNASVTRHPPQPYAAASQWIALAQPDTDLLPLGDMGWMQIEPNPDVPTWTDDYSNLLSALR